MKIEGVIFGWFETGLEATVWAIQKNGTSGNDGLYVIKAGDHLKIMSPTGDVVFDGVIECDSTVGEEGRKQNRNKPSSCGHWIHWYQRGFDPDAWGKFFFPENHKAILTRAK